MMHPILRSLDGDIFHRPRSADTSRSSGRPTRQRRRGVGDRPGNLESVRLLFVLLLAVTLVLAAVGIWVAVTPGSNRWLGREPMLGEFLLGVAPFITGITALVLWRRLRQPG